MAYSIASERCKSHFQPSARSSCLLGTLKEAGQYLERRLSSQPTYAPGLEIRGTIATGLAYTTPETADTMRDDTASQASYTLIYPLYLALLAQRTDPALKASDMFSEKALPLFELTRRACVWQLVLEVLGSGLTRAESVKPAYAKALAANMASLEYPSLKLPQPIFIGIGEFDTDAPAHLQLELAKRACVAGTTAEAHLYAGTLHDAAVTASLRGAIRFADKVLAGEAITSVCEPEVE